MPCQRHTLQPLALALRGHCSQKFRTAAPCLSQLDRVVPRAGSSFPLILLVRAPQSSNNSRLLKREVLLPWSLSWVKCAPHEDMSTWNPHNVTLVEKGSLQKSVR